MSGLHDWVPELDALAGQGLLLTHFLANGIDTEAGLISLLSGEPALARGDTKTVFQPFEAPKNSLPRMLADNGWRTAFLTTGDLDFLDKGRWLGDIGFQLVEGDDAAFYKGMKRYHFDAAPDAALFDRALQFLAQRGSTDAAPLS